jgi:hypothetical protein
MAKKETVIKISNYSTKSKPPLSKEGKAIAASQKATRRVANDKWSPAYAEYTTAEKNAIKAKNVRKAIDLGKTAGRAKNIIAKNKKAAAKKMK